MGEIERVRDTEEGVQEIVVHVQKMLGKKKRKEEKKGVVINVSLAVSSSSV